MLPIPIRMKHRVGAARVCGAATIVSLVPAVPAAAQSVVRVDGTAAGHRAGTSVASAGDVNGDGAGDLIVGAPSAMPEQEAPMFQPGRAYIVFGSRTAHDIDGAQ